MRDSRWIAMRRRFRSFGSLAPAAGHAAGLVVALAGLAAPALGFDMLATDPTRYARMVPRNLSSIQVVFDAPVALPPAAAFRVAGSMSGLHGGTLEVAADTLRIRNLTRAFLPGELVNVNLRSDIHPAMNGGTLTGGRTFAFTIASKPVTPDWSDVTTYGTARVPYFIHGGDMDGDGQPDLAVPNEGANAVSIFLNATGNGAFPTHSEYGVGRRPSSIFGEDFDNDGDQDLATADIDGATMTVLRNTGAGFFTPVASYAAGAVTRQVHGGDFDGDNDVDLCCTSRGTDEVYLFLNRGNGTFVGSSLPVRGGPFAIRTGDLNGDGYLDIAVACQDADSLQVLLNTGTGSFTSAGRYRIDNGPWCLNGNDFDGDGDFDLVSVASFANRLVLLRNDGAGGFPTRSSLPTGLFPLGVFAADVDGDGDIDATASNYSSATVGVYLNDGHGGLALSATLATTLAASYTWAHDLDGDGDLDLSVVDEHSDELFVFRNGGTATDARESGTGLALGAASSLRIVPNPLRANAGARFVAGPAAAPAWIDLYDVAGRHVRRLSNGHTSGAGVEFVWDGRDGWGRTVAAGRYLAVTGGGGRNLKMPLQVVR